MPDRISQNQVAYIAAEASFGVKPANGAFRDLAMMTIERTPMLDAKSYRNQGRRFAAKTAINKDYVDGKSTGDASFTELIYPHSSHWGIITPTAVASANVAKDWKWPIQLSGAITPQSYWLQYGDTVRSDEFGGGVFSGTTVKATRETITAESPFFAQSLQDNATFVPTPPVLPETPMMGKHWQLFMDPSSGSLGSTLLTRVADAEIAYAGAFTPWFAANRASATYTTPVDRAPKAQFTVTLEADSNGMKVLADARQGLVEYFRFFAQGDPVEAQYTVTISGTPTGGSFTLTINGQQTGAIAYNAANSAVQTAIQALTGVGTNCTVTGGPGPGTPFVLTFSGPLALGVTITHTDSFTGGSSPAAAISAATFFYHQYTADLACSLNSDVKYGDADGIYAVTYIFDLVEDLIWGNAGLVTVRNGRATL